MRGRRLARLSHVPYDEAMGRMRLRQVQVREESWRYGIGASAAVIVAPNGQKSVVFLKTLTGRDPDTIERGRYLKTSDGMVTPAAVKKYIERHTAELLLPAPPKLGKQQRSSLAMSTSTIGALFDKTFDSLVERGLVVKRGRYAFITPEGRSYLRRSRSPLARA